MKKIILLLVILLAGCSNIKEGQLIYMEPDKNSPFNFPYYLFIPDDISPLDSLHLIIEPNNSGFVDDDLQKHIEKAERTASREFYLGNYVSRQLKYPLLVPVFPRTRSEWKIYTHALDRDVMEQQNNALERIDLQLLAMADNACDSLEKLGYKMADDYLMTGFSASGSFANRFTALHPDKIKAVAAGGVNGLLILPMSERKDHQLKYPLGVADIEAIIKARFDFKRFRNTPQFYFMGELDSNDAIPYEDGYSIAERELVFQLLGREMQPKRWQACRSIYDSLEINATLKTYHNTGHEQTETIKSAVVEFFIEVLKSEKN
ncbi:MAG: hypothetical protein ACLFQM_12550 [Fidelibacterota bacterium]